MFVGLIRSYVDAINLGAVPNIETAWSYICKDECTKALNEAFVQYQRALREVLISKIPTTNEEIENVK